MPHTITTIKTFLLALLFIGCLASMTCTHGTSYTKEIIALQTTIDSYGITKDINPNIEIAYRNCSLRLLVFEPFSVEPPWEKIIMADGQEVTVRAFIRCADGETITSSIIGMADDEIDIRFPPSSLNGKQIKQVKIIATPCLKVKKVVLSCANYK